MVLHVDHVVPGWEPVRDVLVKNLESGMDRGAGCAVYHHGRLVVDVVGGHRDKSGDVPYDGDTLQLVFSTTKGIASIAVAMCVERGLLDYSEKVAAYWPEFATNGKGDITVAQLLAHRAGLYTTAEQLPLADTLDWPTITSYLASMSPLFEPGSTHGYHAITFGWLAGELVRRVTGKSLGAFVRDEMAAPLGAEMFIGIPDEHQSRVAHIMAHPVPSFPPEIAKIMLERGGPGTTGDKALSLLGTYGPGVFNRPEVRAAEVPGANGISNARSLAAMYAACVGEVNGVRLLSDDTVRTATTSETPAGEMDVVLKEETVFAKGFMVHSERTPFAGPTSFGHNGAGGSCAFAQPERELGFAYVMNTMLTTYEADPRPQELIAAAVRCADSA
jgi:CubicO group peptidase (beta-lactamase class C family)